MLLVGAWKHGFGNWELIQNDPSLGLHDKIFLDDGKNKPAESSAKSIPNAIHLVRRGEYLLHVLREYDENVRSYKETAAKQTRDDDPVGSKRAKPKPANGAANRVAESSAPNRKRRRATPEYTSSDSDESDYPSMDEGACKEALRPVKRQLKQLKAGTEDLPREQRVHVLKECLSAIGTRINDAVSEKAGPTDDKERLRKHLWAFAGLFWPSKVNSKK